MNKDILLKRENEIYEKYQNIIAPYIMELEVRDSEYPIEIMNEKELSSAENHMKRAILDCYKYLCISISEEIYSFRKNYQTVDLKLANNGRFLPELDKLEKFAKDTFIKAKYSEIEKLDDDKQYELFENAYVAYSAVEKHINDSWEAILFASSHSKNSNLINIVACIITVISIIVSIIATL